MLPPLRCPGHRFANAILADDSGSVGQFQAVAPDDDAALLKCLDQNYNAFRVAQITIENARPAGERTGGDAHRIAGTERPLNQFDESRRRQGASEWSRRSASSTGHGRSFALPSTRKTPRLYFTARNETAAQKRAKR